MSNYTYNGIPILADENLHEAAFESFLESNPDKDAKIGVLACGNGAFDQRLIDHGYTNIQSYDIDDKNQSSVEFFRQANLNDDFHHLGEYDYIIALEIIEHIENPSHFLRNISQMMHSKSVLILSTPHLEQIQSRFYALLRNDVPMFNQNILKTSGHISPIYHHILIHFLHNASLETKLQKYNRAGVSSDDLKRASLKETIFKLFIQLVSPFIPGNNGHISIYTIQKKLI